MADRIAAAAERHAVHQQRHRKQQQQLQHHQQQVSHQVSHPNHAALPETTPHDPSSTRFWEARLLSRACQSLAFHISSHFHVPTGPTDPLVSVLSLISSLPPTSPNTSSQPTAGSANGASLPAGPVSDPSQPTAPPSAIPAAAAAAGPTLGTAPPTLELSPADTDPHGVYDHLPAVIALRSLATSLMDQVAWQSLTASERPTGLSTASGTETSTSPAARQPGELRQTNAGVGSVDGNRNGNGNCNGNGNGNGVGAAGHTVGAVSGGANGSASQPGSGSLEGAHAGGLRVAFGAAAGAIDAPEPTAHVVAPTAVNAAAHVVAGALLRLARSCGHPGCYSLFGRTAPPPPPPPPPEGGRDGVAGASAPPPPLPPPLAGLPFTGRQLARLYDMARTADDVDARALAGLSPSAAAALLVLLAAAQPAQHAAGVAAGGRNPAVPAALLARYLRAAAIRIDGSSGGGGSALDTVRVMWALLRLQLPGACGLLLPVECGSSTSSSSSSSSGDYGSSGSGSAGGNGSTSSGSGVGGKEAAAQAGGGGRASGGGAAAAAGAIDPMAQLSCILSRQLADRAAAAAALRAAPRGELYGTWQLAVQTAALLKGRALAAERSAAALAQLDSALELLEAALARSGSGSESEAESKAATAASGSGSGRASSALSSPAIEALQSFIALAKEVGSARQPAPLSQWDPFLLPPPSPAWGVVPGSEEEWRAVLGDHEQRVCLLLSTWPELGRLVVPQGATTSTAAAPAAASTAGGVAAGAPRASPSGEAGAGAVSAGVAGSGLDLAGAAGSGGASHGDGGGGSPWTRRKLRLQLQPYMDLHLRTLELLYRALKSQAPDAQLFAELSSSDEDDDVEVEGASVEASTAAASTSSSGGSAGTTAADAAAERSRRLLRAVALPHHAPVDMVYTDARGRTVGLCLAHLGASRRAPGELAVLQHALCGWPEAEVAAAQERFNAARAAAAASAAAAARLQAATAAAAAPLSAESVQYAVGVASAAVGLLRCTATMAGALAEVSRHTGGSPGHGEGAPSVAATAAAAVGELRWGVGGHLAAIDGVVAAAGAAGGLNGRVQIGGGLSEAERAGLEAAAAALEADAAAILAAPTAAGASQAYDSPGASARQLHRGNGPAPGSGSGSGTENLVLDDILVLELDHDWFHLRESYFQAVSRQNRWTEKVRQEIGAAMTYSELPWEAQLDMVWHVLAGAGAAPPIRVFA